MSSGHRPQARVAACLVWAAVTLALAAAFVLGAGSVIYVHDEAHGLKNGTSWQHAFVHLQAALAAATDGDEIWVTGDWYTPTSDGNREATFQLKSGVAVDGGFDGVETERDQREPSVHVTVLSGDIGTPTEFADNSYHVVTAAVGAVLDGFTIAHGNANGTAGPHDAGGGLYIPAAASMTAVDCVFWDNRGTHGAGVYVEGPTSPVFLSCHFRDNEATDGGGVYSSGALPRFEGCRFDRNEASLWGGGLFCTQSFILLANTVFFSNEADAGAGIHMRSGSRVTLLSCTLSRNLAAQGGSSLHIDGSQALVRNSIMAFDLGGTAKIVKANGATDDVRFSSVGLNYPGTGNTNFEPEFADWINGDLHLKSVVGRWNGMGWVIDFVHCPLIDRGD